MRDIAQLAADCGFSLEGSEALEEIEGTAHVMRHRRSGARLLYLENADKNRAFSIGFKTPAADDTGVFHILEHSVLCGSRRFPVKEPFVNLLKTSMQTFLNAMTFPDKTMYPVASANEQDLMNLMEVYLDAVFQPAIYDKRTIFEQEGWHLEASPEGALAYNGVVYNEMKGALSDPDAVLYDALAAALFPDTTYRFESGGTPEAIPTLTYEAYLDAHRRHYRPDNSYLLLYGDLDAKRFLSFIDREYLSPMADAMEGPLDANPLALQSAVVAQGVRQPMATAPENACCALGAVIGTASERERVIAADILLDAIAGSNEAPLKRAILDAGIAADVGAFVADAMAQPFAVVELKGIEPGAGALERLDAIVAEEARRLVAGGLDHALVEAALAHAEFAMRERNFGYPDGVAYAMASLSGWLYDDELAVAYLRYDDVFESLRAQLESGYFERLLEELFLECPHRASVEVVPDPAEGADPEQAALEALAARMSPGELEEVRREVEQLRLAQEAPDAPADLARLPWLGIADAGEAPEEPACRMQPGPPFDCLRHEVPTNGIAYATRYFPLEGVAFEDMPYVTVLAMALGRLGTQRHSAAELDTLVQRELGTLSFFAEVHEDAERPGVLSPRIVASAAALERQAAKAAELVREVLLETDFSDAQKLLDLLLQKRVAMEQAFATAGHGVATGRAASYYLPAAVLREQLGGIDFYRFLCDLIAAYDERAGALAAKLESLAATLFVDEGSLLSFAGSDASLEAYLEAGAALGGRALPRALEVPAPRNLREALIVPSDVAFVGTGYDRRLLAQAPPYSGSWLVASRVLSYDYLWNEVRVKGGAYGSGFSVTRPGNLSFYSFRDPHVDDTQRRFAEAGSWLAGFEATPRELEGYLVSTVGGLDAPLKPRALIRRQCGMHFSGVTPAMRERVRREVASTTLEQVRALGDPIGAAAAAGCVCAVGGRELLEGSKLGLELVALVGAARG